MSNCKENINRETSSSSANARDVSTHPLDQRQSVVSPSGQIQVGHLHMVTGLSAMF